MESKERDRAESTRHTKLNAKVLREDIIIRLVHPSPGISTFSISNCLPQILHYSVKWSIQCTFSDLDVTWAQNCTTK
jgi:hypothetical protein